MNWYHPEAGRRFYFTGHSRGFYAFAHWDADQQHSFSYMTNLLTPSWLKPTLAIALIDILEGRRPEVAPPIFDEMPPLADFASILVVSCRTKSTS